MTIKESAIFLRKESPFKLRRSVDHDFASKKGREMVLHLIEMKSKVDNKNGMK